MPAPGPGADAATADSSNAGPRPDPDATVYRPTTAAPAAAAGEQATVVSGGTPEPATAWSQPGAQSPTVLTPSGTLPDGAVLASRYRIDKMLGTGGMGSVYKAYDSELDRPIALKLIRSDLASNVAVLQRFKQEIILSREVTHPNVVRIFDLGTSDQLRYITMEFVPGRDLKDVIVERDKIPHEEATDMMIQICRALDAAHSAGVVHRDLKPQNVMVTEDGTAKVMDFGIARSAELSGMTGTGEMLGTPAYMSPEQARGEHADARSDVFSLGIIFYEMLTGELPFEAETAMGSLMRRLQEAAPPPNKIDPDLPDWLNGIVVKCLERDVDLRYKSAADILQDLEQHRAPPQATVFDRVPARIRAMSPGGRRAAAITLLAAMGVAIAGAFVIANWSGAGPGPVEEPAIDAIGLAILPFRNASADESLKWLENSLGEMLRTDIGQSAYLRTVSTDRVRQVLSDLRVSNDATLDAATLDRVANFSGARNLVTGQFLRVGELIRIDATLHDLDAGRETALKAEAPNAESLLAAVGELAAAIRSDLDLGAEAVASLEATSFSPSTSSVDALRAYTQGLQHSRSGDFASARDAYEEATAADPGFALAFSALGRALSDLGFDSEAEDASRAAVGLSANLGAFEKRLIEAQHAWITHDTAAAAAAYEALVRAAPGDPDLRSGLAVVYEQAGNFAAASEQLAAVLRADPDDITALLLAGRVETRSGDPQAALGSLERALELAEDSGNEFIRGRVLTALGLTHRRMNDADAAIVNLLEAVEIQRNVGYLRGVASALSNLAQLYQRRGDLDAALSSLEETLSLSRQIGDRRGEGDALLDLGNYWADRGSSEQAIDTYKESLEVQREVGNQTYSALCLNNIGTVHLARGEYSDARTYFEQALAIRAEIGAPRGMGETLHNLGETHLNLGNYEEALDHLLQGIEQWRMVGDEFGVAAESYDIGIIRGLQGRYAAALEAEVDAVRTFERLDLRDEWMYYATGQHGIALAEAGRLAEAEAALQQAMILAEELQNGTLVAQAYEWQGMVRMMWSDLDGAGALYQQALQAAEEARDVRAERSARLRLAMVEVADGGAARAADTIANLTADARRTGLVPVASEATLYRAQVLIDAGSIEEARREIQVVHRNAERYSLNPLLIRVHYLLGLAAAAEGDEAAQAAQFRQAAQLLDQLAADAGDDDPFRRPDLRALREAVNG